MTDWKVVRLEEIATVERGKFSARPRNDPKYYGGNIPFLQTGDVASATGVILTHSQTLNDEGLKVSKLFPAGTLLITIAAPILGMSLKSVLTLHVQTVLLLFVPRMELTKTG